MSFTVHHDVIFWTTGGLSMTSTSDRKNGVTLVIAQFESKEADLDSMKTCKTLGVIDIARQGIQEGWTWVLNCNSSPKYFSVYLSREELHAYTLCVISGWCSSKERNKKATKVLLYVVLRKVSRFFRIYIVGCISMEDYNLLTIQGYNMFYQGEEVKGKLPKSGTHNSKTWQMF